MKRLELFQQKMKKIEDFASQEDYEAALTLLERLRSDYPSATQLLIKKASLIQLLPEDSELGELSDAQKALELAVEIDPNAVEAILELAHFHSAVLDRAKEARELFDQAIQRCFEFLEAAYHGKIQSLIELGKSDEARRWIAEAQKLFPTSVAISQLQEERKRGGSPIADCRLDNEGFGKNQ